MELHLDERTVAEGEEGFFQQLIPHAEPLGLEHELAGGFLGEGGFASLHRVEHLTDLVDAVTPSQRVGNLDSLGGWPLGTAGQAEHQGAGQHNAGNDMSRGMQGSAWENHGADSPAPGIG